MGKIHDGMENSGPMGSQSKAGYPVLWWGVGFLGRPAAWAAGLAGAGDRKVRRTIISAVIGAALAAGVMTAIDGYQNIRTAARFAEMQQAAPSDWLELSTIQVKNAVLPDEPGLQFVGTPAMDLLIRLAVSPREAETGNVICSGGGRPVLYEGGIPVNVNARLSSLAGLDACDFPVGRYRVRLNFMMTEPGSQITKTLLVETADLEVIAPPSP